MMKFLLYMIYKVIDSSYGKFAPDFPDSTVKLYACLLTAEAIFLIVAVLRLNRYDGGIGSNKPRGTQGYICLKVFID